MKTFLKTLTITSLSLSSIIPLTKINENINENKIANQEISKTYQYQWTNDGRDLQSYIWMHSNTDNEAKYDLFFYEDIDLETATKNDLTNIEQITNITIKPQRKILASAIAWKGERFISNPENTIDKIMAASSLTEKMSGNSHVSNNKDLYDGAQYQILELDTINREGKAFKAGITFGLEVYYNEFNNNHLTATVWSALFYQMSEAIDYLGVYNSALLQIGQSLQFDYNY
ncbi:MAG: hypothetical protein REH79_01755 [Spiroplasma sp.]|nr:hypothetical protein [Spiroplasma sp.]